jgi:hypothetical protein
MAITKASSKSESWTVRIPNDLVAAVRAKFPSGAGSTQIVIEAIKHLLGIDSSILSNNVSNDSLTELKLELDEIRSRLAAIEQSISFNKSITSPDKPAAIDQEWISLATVAAELRVKPKSISGAASRRGESIGNDIIKFDMNGKTIHKKGSGLTALYQLQ